MKMNGLNIDMNLSMEKPPQKLKNGLNNRNGNSNLPGMQSKVTGDSNESYGNDNTQAVVTPTASPIRGYRRPSNVR